LKRTHPHLYSRRRRRRPSTRRRRRSDGTSNDVLGARTAPRTAAAAAHTSASDPRHPLQRCPRHPLLLHPGGGSIPSAPVQPLSTAAAMGAPSASTRHIGRIAAMCCLAGGGHHHETRQHWVWPSGRRFPLVAADDIQAPAMAVGRQQPAHSGTRRRKKLGGGAWQQAWGGARPRWALAARAKGRRRLAKGRRVSIGFHPKPSPLPLSGLAGHAKAGRSQAKQSRPSARRPVEQTTSQATPSIFFSLPCNLALRPSQLYIYLHVLTIKFSVYIFEALDCSILVLRLFDYSKFA